MERKKSKNTKSYTVDGKKYKFNAELFEREIDKYKEKHHLSYLKEVDEKVGNFAGQEEKTVCCWRRGIYAPATLDMVYKVESFFGVGKGSFPKLKIPHQSHADFCSTDTAGGLDNKKRRYAPRGGVAYRLFLWGFPKGATPPFGTRLCEAKCSVLYALPALP